MATVVSVMVVVGMLIASWMMTSVRG